MERRRKRERSADVLEACERAYTDALTSNDVRDGPEQPLYVINNLETNEESILLRNDDFPYDMLVTHAWGASYYRYRLRMVERDADHLPTYQQSDEIFIPLQQPGDLTKLFSVDRHNAVVQMEIGTIEVEPLIGYIDDAQPIALKPISAVLIDSSIR